MPGVLTMGRRRSAPVDDAVVAAYARDLADCGLPRPRRRRRDGAGSTPSCCPTWPTPSRRSAVPRATTSPGELTARADAEGRAVLHAAGIASLDDDVHDAARADFPMEPPPRAGAWRRVVVAVAGPRAPGRSSPTTSTARSSCSAACTACRRRSTPCCSGAPGRRPRRERARDRSGRPCCWRRLSPDGTTGTAPCRCRARRGVTVVGGQEAAHVTLGHVQLPPCWTVNPKDVVWPAASAPLPLGRIVMTLPEESHVGVPFQVAMIRCGDPHRDRRPPAADVRVRADGDRAVEAVVPLLTLGVRRRAAAAAGGRRRGGRRRRGRGRWASGWWVRGGGAARVQLVEHAGVGGLLVAGAVEEQRGARRRATSRCPARPTP